MALLTPDVLFERVAIVPSGSVNWRADVPHDGTGVYVISLSELDAVRYDDRFHLEEEFWTPEQQIIYIGRARNLKRRLRQFYSHQYGSRSPHRGGQAILLLVGTKTITWAAVEDYKDAERELIEAFEKEVGRKPFGNRARPRQQEKCV